MRSHVMGLFASVAVILAVFLAAGHAQEDMRVVDNSGFDEPRRSPALFNHDAHNETAELEDCGECHHVYEDGKRLEDETSEDQRCGDCHEHEDDGRKPALMKAFHSNCKGCHEAEGKGPVMCGECHKK
jgi:Class III cytochrome C family